MRVYENEEENGLSSREKGSYDLVVTPSSVEQAISALDNIDNYGKYISNIRTDKASLQKALDDHFGPSLPVKKKSLEKQRGKPFPPKTKQAIDDFIKSFTSKPDILVYIIKDNMLVFPKSKNPNKELTKSIIKTVLGNAGVDYSIEEKESLDENIIKLKKVIKEEVKKVLKENKSVENILKENGINNDKENFTKEQQKQFLDKMKQRSLFRKKIIEDIK